MDEEEPSEVIVKKHVTDDMSGHCRFATQERMHVACRVEWETPSAYVVCSCPCHAAHGQMVTRPVVRKVLAKKAVVVKKMPAGPSGVVVKKKHI